MNRWRVAWNLGLIFAMVCFLAGPGYRWILTHEFHRTAELSTVFQSMTANPLSGDLIAEGIVDPIHASRVDRLVARISPKELLKRRLCIEKASLQGIHFPSQANCRATMVGEFEVPSAAHDVDWFPDSLMGGSGDTIWRAFEEESTLEKERQDADQRWRASFQSLEREKEMIEKEIQQLFANQSDSANPLRDVKLVQESVQQSKAISGKLKSLQARIEDTSKEFRDSANRLEATKKGDLAKIANRQLAKLDSKSVAQSILRELAKSLYGKLHQRASLTQIASGEFKSPGFKSPEPTGSDPSTGSQSNALVTQASRGVDFRFSSMEGAPLLVKSARWNGDILIGGHMLKLEGEAEGITIPSSGMSGNVSGHPSSQAMLVTGDSEETLIRSAILQGLHGSTESLEITAKNFGHRSWQITNQQGLCLTCNGSPLTIHLQAFHEDGNRRVILDVEQTNAEFSFQGSTSPAGERIGGEIRTALQPLQRWSLHAEVLGDPACDADWSVQSNLEEPIEGAFQGAIRSEIVLHQFEIQKRFENYAASIKEQMESDFELSKGKLLLQLAESNERLTSFRNQSLAKFESKGTRAIRTANGGSTKR